MAFDASRPDRTLLARLPFCDEWLALEDPSDAGECNALDVRGRMALYRLLVERCNPRRAFGEHDERSPFWGYASQLAWQHRSGRLGHDRDARSVRIDADSWWGACNYALSVVPYLAAMNLGFVPRLRFARGGEIGPYRRAVDSWMETFRAWMALRRGDDLEPIRFATWHSHLASIRAAVDANEASLATMSSAERRFALGWVRMVDLFGVAALRTDLEVLARHGGGTLPSRALRASDADLARCDLPRDERRTVQQVFALADRPSWQWRIELAAWRRIMRSHAARDDVDGVFGSLFGRGRRVWPARARTVAYATLPVPVLDASRWMIRTFVSGR